MSNKALASDSISPSISIGSKRNLEEDEVSCCYGSVCSSDSTSSSFRKFMKSSTRRGDDFEDGNISDETLTDTEDQGESNSVDCLRSKNPYLRYLDSISGLRVKKEKSVLEASKLGTLSLFFSVLENPSSVSVQLRCFSSTS